MAKYRKRDTEGTKIFAILSVDGFWSKEKLVFTTEGLISDKSIGKSAATKFEEIEREDNIISFGKDKFDCKHVDMGNLYDLIQELSEEYARYSNQKNNSGTYNAIPMSQTTAYITSNDDNYSRYGD